jgi:multicomponent Na+:H+ antiporter subunit B
MKQPSPILQTTVRLLLPVIALVAIIVTLQGHNKPGGGFIGGLVLACTVALEAMAFGVAAAKQLLRWDPLRYVIVGLLVALASGVVALVDGAPFMTGVWTEVVVPGLGAIKIGTPLFFDIGVFLVVVGSGALLVVTLMEEDA